MNRAVDDALRVLYNQYKNLPVEIVKAYDDASPAVEGKLCQFGAGLINIIPQRPPGAPAEEKGGSP